MVTPFPWASLPRVERRSVRVVAAAAAWLTRGARDLGRRGPRGPQHLGAVDDLEVVGGRVLHGEALARRLAEVEAAVAVVRVGEWEAHVVGPGALVRAVGRRVLGGPEELDAPRPPTVAERAVWVAAVAATLAAHGCTGEVEGTGLTAPALPDWVGGEAAVVEVAVTAPAAATVAVVLPPAAVVAPPRAPLAGVQSPALDLELAVPLLLGRTSLTRAELAGLRPRDVLVTGGLQRHLGVLAIGRGGLRVGLALARGRVTVLAAYARDPMDETLADDAAVDVAVVVGDHRLSVRSLLELRPGHVLELGRPIGSAVELRVGARVVARGELVDVDGDVGVRITSID